MTGMLMPPPPEEDAFNRKVIGIMQASATPVRIEIALPGEHESVKLVRFFCGPVWMGSLPMDDFMGMDVPRILNTLAIPQKHNGAS